jgi:hypothetical protein
MDTPVDADLVDASGELIPGIRFWLDDACRDGNPERRANHKLAAASPTMLAALRAVQAWLDSGENTGTFKVRDAVLVRAAIDCAEGQL